MWEVDTGNINNFLYIYFQKRCKDVGQQLVGDVIQRASFFKLHGQHVCFHPDWTETIKKGNLRVNEKKTEIMMF